MKLKFWPAFLILLLSTSPILSQEIIDSSLSLEELEKKKTEIILLKNQKELLPLQSLESKRIFHLSIQSQGKDFFQESLSLYAPILRVRQSFRDLPKRIDRIKEILQDYNLIVLSIHNSVSFSGLNKSEKLAILDFWQYLSKEHELITTFFGSEKELALFPLLAKSDALLFTASEHPVNQEYCAQIIFGAISSSGRLRKDIGNFFHKGNGLRTSGEVRLAYNKAEAVSWSSQRLNLRIDSLIKMGINAQAFPGCQVWVAKDNQVIFHKSYGHHTYEKLLPVKKRNLYDLASLTKTSAALPAIMYLKDEEKIDLDAPLSRYWPDLLKSNKSQLKIRPILAHQAGLIPYIVFYEKGLKKNGALKGSVFKQDSSAKYPIKVYKNLYMRDKYRTKMYKLIQKSELNPKQGYVYSGLSFLLYPQIVQNLSGMSFEALLREKFYKKLGANSLGFNPWQHFPKSEIVPTEYDSTFRKSLIHAYVHDEAAAMFGGVSGNAGLFANANDLGKLMQMYVNKGIYGGEQYLNAETLREFSSYAYKKEGNRRGLGFDKPALEGNSYIAKGASSLSFGHSGFTGTFAWADPKHKLVIVFLSNRVYPSRTNRKLYSLKIREQLHQILYDEISWASTYRK
ncbi:MAG: serine hydrolase [Bacteroidota bacterium]